MENIIDFIESNTVLKSLYDVIRIIDPNMSKEIIISEQKETILKESCYQFWGTSKQCKNCVTMRAFINNKSFTKIEYNRERIFLVVACPINFGQKKYVLELLKDITETGVIENIEKRTGDGITTAMKEMNDLIIKDELTGVYNRRFINEQLPFALLNSKLKVTSLTVMMIDIDNFKDVNDNYGHLGGDTILSQVSHLIQEKITEDIGWIARYGGDEFFILLDNIDISRAFEIAENLRTQVYETIFVYNKESIKVSVSIGIYSCDNMCLTAEEVIYNVDKKLYLAKEKGRNKTEV
jgi:diguanylate cyclase (GGDEF)-like protein